MSDVIDQPVKTQLPLPESWGNVLYDPDQREPGPVLVQAGGKPVYGFRDAEECDAWRNTDSMSWPR
jgi:hypothetical protein